MAYKGTRTTTGVLATRLCASLLVAAALVLAMSAFAYAADDGEPTGRANGNASAVEGNGGAALAGGEEASVCTVTFGEAGSIKVAKGGTVAAEDIPNPGKTEVDYFGLTADANFLGWKASYSSDLSKRSVYPWRIGLYDAPENDPDVSKNLEGIFSSSTVVEGDVNLQPVYAVPLYRVDVSIQDSTGSSSSYPPTNLAIPAGRDYSVSDSPSFQKYAEQYLGGTEDRVFEGYYRLKDGSSLGEPYDVQAPVKADENICAVFKGSNADVEIPVAGDAGVKAQGTLNGSNIPDGATVALSAAELTSGTAYDELVAAMGSGTFAGVFEVNLSADGIALHEGFGSLMLSFPVGEEANGHWVTVWHRLNDGHLLSNRVIAKDGMATITVTSLSAFALEVGELAEDPAPIDPADTTPVASVKPVPSAAPLASTGDPLSVSGVVMLGLAVVVCAGIAVFAARTLAGKRK